MSEVNHKLSISEKVGYAMGDAASNLVWRAALAFLAVFYTDVYGISAESAALLILIVRLSDGITDILMGMIADRTNTRMGKFRPWILWSAPVLGVFMVLAFTTPDFSPAGKLAFAYFTYIGLTLAYTVSNVPYSALMGVMTPDHGERNVLSGYRFAGAFFGGIMVTGFLVDLVDVFGQGNKQQGYQYSMMLFAVLLVIMFTITVFTTKERVKPVIKQGASLKQEMKDLCKNLPFIVIPLLAITMFFYYRNLVSGIFFVIVIALCYYFIKKLIRKPESETTHTQRDLIDLLTNIPWVILLAIGFLFMMFNGIKQGTTVYYFKWVVGNEALAGKYLIALLVVSMIAALMTGYLGKIFGKKRLFIGALALGGITTGAISFIEPGAVMPVFVLGCISEVFAAVMPVLFFSMLGDAADYSEWKNNRRATGLIYSAGTFINKTGGGFAGAMILIVLAGYGYNGMDPSTVQATLPGMILLMSWIPAVFAFIAAVVMMLYPLNEAKMAEIESDLETRRAKAK